jgi:hypothetical protein
MQCQRKPERKDVRLALLRALDFSAPRERVESSVIMAASMASAHARRTSRLSIRPLARKCDGRRKVTTQRRTLRLLVAKLDHRLESRRIQAASDIFAADTPRERSQTARSLMGGDVGFVAQ